MADQVKERPILFSAPMVRAILDGTKTQTRRVVKPQPYNDPAVKGVMRYGDTAMFGALAQMAVGDEWRCLYGKPGERLWVRESTHRTPMPNILTGEPLAPIYDVGSYSADNEPVVNEHGFDLAWWYSKKACPSIHMPRWASRILLEITEVRVERLRSISEADALAEGIVRLPDGGFGLPKGEHYHAADPRISYLSLWESINGPGSVEADPWVWAVSFRRLTP